MLILGIQGAKGAPLPNLCFTQLTLPLCQHLQKATIFAMKSVTYTQTYEQTHTQHLLSWNLSQLQTDRQTEKWTEKRDRRDYRQKRQTEGMKTEKAGRQKRMTDRQIEKRDSKERKTDKQRLTEIIEWESAPP